jgi:hypothetical protein
MTIRRTLIATATLLALLVPASRAAADCQMAGPIEEVLPTAPVAFVGTAAEVEGPIARFVVAEVWAGAIGATVEVRGLGDPGGPDTGFGAGFSEDDRHWVEGTTYLVLPVVDGDVLRDHLCTATTEWRAELEALRPEGAGVVEPPAADATPPTAILLLAAAVAVVVIGAVVAFRRR